MKDDNKKRQRNQRKAQRANELKAKFEQEKDLKNEAYFFIIESGNFDNFKKWIDNRRNNGQTAATAHKECVFAILKTATATDGDQPTPNQPHPISETTLIETLKDCNATQRRLIQLQAEKIESLTAQLNTLKLYPFKAAK